MSWSFTVDNLTEEWEIPIALSVDMSRANVKYPDDMELALSIAKATGLRSCTCTGMRYDNPYTGDELVDISVRGFMISTDFNGSVLTEVRRGPDVPAS